MSQLGNTRSQNLNKKLFLVDSYNKNKNTIVTRYVTKINKIR